MKAEEIIKKCHEISKNPKSYMRREKKAGGLKYIGYTCIFAPEELFHAAGFTPVRILGFDSRMPNSEKYLPSNCCEFVKSLVESLQADENELWDGLVFSHCCDTLQVVADVSPKFYANKIYRFNVPTNFDGKHSVKYMNSEVLKLKTRLEEQSGRSISPESLKNSWSIYTQNRRLIGRFYELRKEKPGVISGYDSMAVMTAGLFMKKEAHNGLLRELIEELEKKAGYEKPGKRILLSGITNGNAELIGLIEQSGCTVVDEDLCETSRSMPRVIEEEFILPDSFSSLLQSRYCPVKNYTGLNYHDLLIKRYEDIKADGIIFTLFPFCDPQFIDYAILKRKLSERKVKSLLVEVVVGGGNFAQIQTRIEAFIESLN